MRVFGLGCGKLHHRSDYSRRWRFSDLNNKEALMAAEDKIKSIIAEQLGVKPEEVTPTASFVDDLGADSLDTVELIMALEEEFNVEIPDEDAEKMKTVGDVIKYIED